MEVDRVNIFVALLCSVVSIIIAVVIFPKIFSIVFAIMGLLLLYSVYVDYKAFYRRR